MLKLSWILVGCLLFTVTTRMTEKGKALENAETLLEEVVESEADEPIIADPKDTPPQSEPTSKDQEDVEVKAEDEVAKEEVAKEEEIETEHEIVPVI